MTGRIHEFDPVIYPMRLWVAVLPDFKTADRTFYFLNDDGEVVDDAKAEFDSHSSAVATTFLVAHRKTHWKGALVAVWRRKECTVGVCAHEATHVYDFMDREFGLHCQDFDNDEPKAYAVQWIADSINKVLKGNVR